MRVPYRKPGKYSQMKQDPMLTEAKAAELQQKLERLKNFSRPKAAEEVKRLAELGDFSENVEYQLAKGKLRGINQTILTIEHQLKQAEIIAAPKQTDIVRIGHTVTIQSNGKERAYLILGSTETDPAKGIISHVSPLGQALLDHAVGDTVIISAQNGKPQTNYTILKIE